jgi:uncharacterized protein YciI
MFIVELTYKVSLTKIDEFLNEHIDYLNTQYKLDNFIASGRKVPRNGGIILSKASSKEELLKILNDDPFKKFNLATYKIIEFIPSKTSKQLKYLIE